mmetsp:Transcript_4694/g.19126  ORF Transcript_4694/g.19126 Transcript_4694/m.19126 type:complete len:280 (+) Transcript_4694:954-1793(+)
MGRGGSLPRWLLLTTAATAGPPPRRARGTVDTTAIGIIVVVVVPPGEEAVAPVHHAGGGGRGGRGRRGVVGALLDGAHRVGPGQEVARRLVRVAQLGLHARDEEDEPQAVGVVERGHPERGEQVAEDVGAVHVAPMRRVGRVEGPLGRDVEVDRIPPPPAAARLERHGQRLVRVAAAVGRVDDELRHAEHADLDASARQDRDALALAAVHAEDHALVRDGSRVPVVSGVVRAALIVVVVVVVEGLRREPAVCGFRMAGFLLRFSGRVSRSTTGGAPLPS